LHKCSLAILRCVSAVAAKLSSWKCENKLIKASWHLKDKSKNRNYQNYKKFKSSIAWRRQEKFEKVKTIWLSQEGWLSW